MDIVRHIFASQKAVIPANRFEQQTEPSDWHVDDSPRGAEPPANAWRISVKPNKPTAHRPLIQTALAHVLASDWSIQPDAFSGMWLFEEVQIRMQVRSRSKCIYPTDIPAHETLLL